MTDLPDLSIARMKKVTSSAFVASRGPSCHANAVASSRGRAFGRVCAFRAAT
jgi:hypothetical protein